MNYKYKYKINIKHYFIYFIYYLFIINNDIREKSHTYFSEFEILIKDSANEI